MKKLKLNRKRQIKLHFINLFNKKSSYLTNLSKLKTEGIKEIENEKIDILIEKYLGINKFERDYSFFNPSLLGSQSPTNSKKNKLKIFPELKILITSPLEKEEPNRYKPKNYIDDNFSNRYKSFNKNKQGIKNQLYEGSKQKIKKNLYVKTIIKNLLLF